MPVIASSLTAAPAPPADPGNRAPARSSSQDTTPPGSFGEAMARSRASGSEKAAEPAVRPAASRPVRRPPEAEKATTPDAIDPMAALPLLLESRLAAAAMPASAAAAGPAEQPPFSVTSGPGSPEGPAAVFTAPDGLAGALGTSADQNARVALAAEPAASAAMVADPAPLPLPLPVPVPMTAPATATATTTAAHHSPPGAANPALMAALADATRAGPSGPSDRPDPSDPSPGRDDDANSTATAFEDLTKAAPAPADVLQPAGTGALAPPAGNALLQPASAPAPNAPAPLPSAQLLPAVGSSEWSKALGQQVIQLSTADRQTAELQLNPPGLGPLKVTLSLNDQQMQVAFVSAHSSVRAAVESALPQLRALLAESGISLGQTSVGAESQPQTAFANGQGDSGRPSPRPAYPAKDAVTAALFSTPAVAAQHRPGQGLRIDTYA